MKTGKLVSGGLLLIAVLYACLSTLTTPRTCAVTVNVQATRTATLDIEPLTLAKRLALYAEQFLSVPQASAYIPSVVANVRVTVTAAGMPTIMHNENAAGQDSVSFVLEVPVGPARSFLVEGLSQTSAVVASGQAVVDLTGAALTVPITMIPGTVTVPELISTSPVDGATGVPLRPVISATFSEPMDERTITDQSFTVVRTSSGQPVAGAVSASGATAIFTLTSDLAPNADYTVTISTAVRSAYGVHPAQDQVWLFTTVPTVPAVIGTSPGDNETGVALNARLTAAFSEPMDPATINASAFLLSIATGSVTYDAPSRVAVLTPSSALAAGQTYTATITASATSMLGAPMAADHVWSFTTGTAADNNAPSFGGLSSVTVLSLTSMQLDWPSAVDDMTPAGSIVYLIYQATASGGQDFLNPTYQTAPGATTYQVNGLTPGTTYFFVVRARDEAGNIDGNLVERSAAYPGLYVDAATGSDQSGNGSEAAPFRTITKALSVSPGNLGIYVATGLYDTAAGEVFPLQLKPATALVCRGAAVSSVIDATGSGADTIYGNEGSTIENCTVLPEANHTGIDDRIGGSGGAPGRIDVSGTVIDGPSSEAVVFSASSSLATSTITGTGGSGVLIAAGRPAVTGNEIRGKQVGIEVAANTDPTIDGNRIENNGIGVVVTAAGGRPSVRNNTISNNATGVLVSAGAPLIHKNEVKTNTIAGNDVGIEIAGGMPTVSFNTVTQNSTGVRVSGGTPSIKSNDIFCNSTADLQVLVDYPIDARKDAWDHGPPTLGLAPCVPGTDICYSIDPAGLPYFDPYSAAAPGACP